MTPLLIIANASATAEQLLAAQRVLAKYYPPTFLRVHPPVTVADPTPEQLEQAASGCIVFAQPELFLRLAAWEGIGTANIVIAGTALDCVSMNPYHDGQRKAVAVLAPLIAASVAAAGTPSNADAEELAKLRRYKAEVVEFLGTDNVFGVVNALKAQVEELISRQLTLATEQPQRFVFHPDVIEKIQEANPGVDLATARTINLPDGVNLCDVGYAPSEPRVDIQSTPNDTDNQPLHDAFTGTGGAVAKDAAETVDVDGTRSGLPSEPRDAQELNAPREEMLAEDQADVPEGMERWYVNGVLGTDIMDSERMGFPAPGQPKLSTAILRPKTTPPPQALAPNEFSPACPHSTVDAAGMCTSCGAFVSAIAGMPAPPPPADPVVADLANELKDVESPASAVPSVTETLTKKRKGRQSEAAK